MFVRTLLYVGVAVGLSLLIGYPVAYYVSRQARGRTKALLLVLLVAPFWISYLMRMFAWTNLLATDGYAADVLNALSIDSLFSALGPAGRRRLARRPADRGDPRARLRLRAVPDPAALRVAGPDRPAADRGRARPRRARPSGAFRRVVLPLSKAGTLGGIVLIALPMFGDYYTPDLMSGSPKTAMLGNTINNYVQGGPDKALGRGADAAAVARSCSSSCSITCATLRTGGGGVRRTRGPAAR